MSRYARQIAVPGIGEAGQQRIASIEVEVRGEGLAAEICALYLAGAGVKRLVVADQLIAKVAAINSTVEIGGAASMVVEPSGDDPVVAGAEAARCVLARGLAT